MERARRLEDIRKGCRGLPGQYRPPPHQNVGVWRRSRDDAPTRAAQGRAPPGAYTFKAWG